MTVLPIVLCTPGCIDRMCPQIESQVPLDDASLGVSGLQVLETVTGAPLSMTVSWTGETGTSRGEPFAIDVAVEPVGETATLLRHQPDARNCRVASEELRLPIRVVLSSPTGAFADQRLEGYAAGDEHSVSVRAKRPGTNLPVPDGALDPKHLDRIETLVDIGYAPDVWRFELYVQDSAPQRRGSAGDVYFIWSAEMAEH